MMNQFSSSLLKEQFKVGDVVIISGISSSQFSELNDTVGKIIT